MQFFACFRLRRKQEQRSTPVSQDKYLSKRTLGELDLIRESVNNIFAPENISSLKPIYTRAACNITLEIIEGFRKLRLENVEGGSLASTLAPISGTTLGKAKNKKIDVAGNTSADSSREVSTNGVSS